MGTAALAHNVAGYLHRPVIGFVSGFRMSNLLTEALGDWFVPGARNVLRNAFARVFDAYPVKDHAGGVQSHRTMKEHFESTGIDKYRFIYGSPDSATSLYLLSKLGAAIDLIVGHGKGNLNIENVRKGLLASCRKRGAPIHTDICIVTLAAITRIPSEFRNVHQFIGKMDHFGMMNSRPLVDQISIPNARHWLNTAIPGHLSVHNASRAAAVQ